MAKKNNFLPSRLTTPFTVEAKVKFQPPRWFGPVSDKLLALAQPEVLGPLVRQAAAETLLVAYRRRFLSALPSMVNMKRDKSGKWKADPVLGKVVRKRVMDLYRRLDQATLSGRRDDAVQIRKELNLARADVTRRLQMRDSSREGRLPTGRFRRLALKVLDLVANVQNVEILGVNSLTGGSSSLHLGIGSITALDAIKTPSATPDLAGHETSSRNNILWRHLEFGTGAFSTRTATQSSRYRLPSGGWWYGRSEGESLHLRGSKPGKMLGDPVRGLPYAAESQRFYTVLFRMLNEALSPR